MTIISLDEVLVERLDPPTAHDVAVVKELLGRAPQGRFSVVLRSPEGMPVVLANEPLLASGRPMPTLFWLVDRDLVKQMGQLESTGGVNRAEAEVDPAALQAAHERYAQQRDAMIAATYDGPRPFGGVAGTRVGVKCLHAHYAYHLVGGDDPVGRWIEQELATPSPPSSP